MKRSTLQNFQRAASTATKAAGDISSVFPSLSGKAPEPLPPRFSELKKRLIAGNEDAVKASWHRLLKELRTEVDEVKQNGNSVIPTMDFSTIQNPSAPIIKQMHNRGVAIIRNVLPSSTALTLKSSTKAYIQANNSSIRAFPASSPAVYELYWSPPQVAARSHPSVLATQTFLASLWHSSSTSSTISTTHPLTYADRLRIRQPGDAQFALGPHTDGGSVERWEDPEYSNVYHPILTGNWEAYDAFDAKHRISAQMNMYNAGGGCSMFRLFQGWLSMSETGPGEGTLQVCALPLRHATAYLMLRPFFNLATNELDLDSTDFPGSALSAAQEYNATTHPHLELESTMVNIPKVQPGDFVAWHCDGIHAVDKQHAGEGDSSVLYIPACPMTSSNLEFLKQQRDAALKGIVPPDFPGAGSKELGEGRFEGKVDWEARAREDAHGMRAMGLGKTGWEVTQGMSEGERRVVEEGNRLLFS